MSTLTTVESMRSPLVNDEEVAAASIVVTRFRSGLDLTLAIPEWQDAIRLSLLELNLPGQRQGVSFVQAVLSLPLESKRDLLKLLLKSQLRRPGRRSTIAIRQAWGIISPTIGETSLAATQWRDLKRKVSLRLASHYRSYKNAQSLLYSNFEYIAKQATREICRDKGRKEDCEQEGALGLLQAIDRIESNRPFASYAFRWTSRRIRNYLMKSSLPITAPINQISKVSRSESNESTHQLNQKELTLALACLQRPHLEFTDEVASSAANEMMNEAHCPIAIAVKNELIGQLDEALTQLTAKQREVLALRFGILNREVVETLQGIARITGISRQQVTRRERRALSKLEDFFAPLLNELA